MGNMLESDSSGNSDIEETKDKPKERTAGDGMESDNINLLPNNTVINKDASSLARMDNSSSSAKLNSTENSSANIVHDGNDNLRKIFKVKDQQQDLQPISSPTTILLSSTNINNIAGKSMSPRQLPSRDLLIPVKPPPRLDNNNFGASAKSPKLVPFDNTKQKNPKFVPYEPYSAAIRPIITTSQNKGHTRKPSDSSSIVSQSSTISTCESQSNKQLNNEATGNYSPSPQTPNKHGPTHHFHQHPSTTLMKERLKMAEKEICDLQSENARLKKLFVDSMAGVSCPISTGGGAGAVADSINNFNITTTTLQEQNANNLQHRNKECVDNLNDELEVSRSKFLSSCVLVDQLTKDNHDQKATIDEAAEIILLLKNTASLTQVQYQNINEWLRKTHHTSSYSSLPLDNDNFCQEEEDYYKDTPSS